MSDTAPKDQGALLWNAPKLAAPKPSAPAELLFEFLRGHDRYRCELRDLGQWGMDVQWFKGGDFLYSHRLETRGLAVAWAERERTHIEAGERWALTESEP